MARVHFVKKARKNNSVVKKGESYYWWQFRFGGKHYSKTQPKQSQLTQSEFLSQVYDLNDRLSELSITDDIESEVQSIIDEIRSLGDECQDKRDNMPEQLQDSGSGEILQNRVDSCEDWASNLESIDLDVDEDLKDDEKEERIQEILDEIQGFMYEGE
jgi:hypothetical protein